MLDVGSNSFPSQEKLGIGFSPAFHNELWEGNMASEFFKPLFSSLSNLVLSLVSARIEETGPSVGPLTSLNAFQSSLFLPRKKLGAARFSLIMPC